MEPAGFESQQLLGDQQPEQEAQGQARREGPKALGHDVPHRTEHENQEREGAHETDLAQQGRVGALGDLRPSSDL